ncbi:MAG: hypothetical protein ACRDPY_05425 [Streptosporangiaceae bacterium]
MPWEDKNASKAARRNRRIRGYGTWGEQTRRLHRFQQQKYRREQAGGDWENTSNSLGIRENRRIRGHGTWSAQTRRLDREVRRRGRGRGRQSSATLGKAGSAVSVGALILGVVLLMSPATRGVGVVMLVVMGLFLYVVAGRKRA